MTRPHNKPRVNHGVISPHRLAELGRSNEDVLTARGEAGWRIHRAADDDEVMVEPGARAHRRDATDDDDGTLDYGRGFEPHVAKHHHDIAEHLAGNRGVGHDDDRLADGGVLPEVQRRPDPQDRPCIRDAFEISRLRERRRLRDF